MAINNYLYDQPISAILSILIISGIYFFGMLILKNSKVGKIISLISNHEYQAITIATYCLVLLIFPLIFFFKINNFFLQFLGFILLLAGIINIFIHITRKRNYLIKYSFEDKILFTSLLLLFLWCLGPITNADSLAYHGKVALDYLNKKEIYDVLYFQSFLFGALDTLSIFGFANGCEQLVSLIQFSSILSLIGILKKNSTSKNVFFLLTILIVSSPLLFQFTGSLKPDLILIAGSAISFALTLNLSKKFNYFIFLLILGAILTVNILSKISFILSSLIIFLFLFFNKKTFQKLNLIKLIIILSLFLFVYIIPFYLLKINYFEKLDFKSFLILVPNDFPSQNNFISHLKGAPLTIESIFYFIVPKSFSTVTELLGYTPLILIFLFLKNFKKNNNGIILILLLFILTVLFSQSRSRFYFEIFIWTLVYLSFNLKKRNIYNINFLKIISIPQFLTFNILLIFGISTISIGSINQDLREEVLVQKAYGYNIFKWLNTNVPKDAVIISTHRSISLADFDVISGDFIELMDNKNQRDIKLIELLKDKKPTHIFFMSSDNIQTKKINNINFENCVGKLIKKTEKIKTSVTRNPFNKGNIMEQNLHLYEFDYKKLPDCYQ